MIAALHFLSESVFGDSWIEVASLLTLLAFVGGVYHHVECQQQGCRRPGIHPHGHLKLCAHHHPKVDGPVTQDHIDAVTAEQSDPIPH